ncbi:amino oxidase family protein [Tupanvirus deep ocean]|uniref:Amino oxidase family protein n=2 Tax=Tupanvirus TaxID=2094720 RepID=A0AC62A9C9_9VIRU|nr:amino oxidase family protein [Tupanvirus deep ocean]QKU34309.1 amino oxidase family protein [Tupanvirus deep ocean]
MSYLIIGGGISGLYSAYSLHKNFGVTNITVIEKENKLGGRINTMYVDDIFLEMGAGGVVNTQKNIMKLLDELGLKDKLNKGGGGRSLVISESIPTSNFIVGQNEKVPTIYKIKDIIDIKDTDFYDIIETLTERLKNKIFYETAISYNLYRLIEKLYGYEKADTMMYQFGFHADFYEQNAVEALDMFKKEFSRDAKFHRINGGMIQIINALASYLRKNNITIKTNCKCIDISKNKSKYICSLENGGWIESDNIIISVPKMNMLKINFFTNFQNKINSVIHKPLSRIYAFFPKVDGKIWFDSINTSLTTKTLMNQIIPIDKEKGILMIYCDSVNAKTWHYFDKNGILERELMYHLTKLFSDIIIPSPTKIYVSYYDSATHVWKPSVDPYQMYKKVMQPIEGENIYIVGETYSLNQQWSEGAIQSVNDLMELLYLEFENASFIPMLKKYKCQVT